MLKSIEEQGSKEVKKNGNTYISPADGEAPPNLMAWLASDKTFELGTEGYVASKGRDFLSSSLAKVWKSNPKSNAIRLSVDVESNRKFVNEAMKMARQQAPPSVQGFLGMVDDLSTLSLAIDVDSKDLVVLTATGKDESNAKNLDAAINGLLGMGRMMGQQALNNPDMDEASKKTMTELLGSLKAETKGNTVTLRVPKPEGFEAMLKKMQPGNQ